MGVFFVSWKLWLQMTFVLLGALLLTIFAGLFKLFFAKRTMRKMDQVAARLRDEENVKHIAENQNDLSNHQFREKDPLPRNKQFGIEQLLYGGVADHGVVDMSTPNSRATSRANSVVGTPTASMINLASFYKTQAQNRPESGRSLYSHSPSNATPTNGGGFTVGSQLQLSSTGSQTTLFARASSRTDLPPHQSFSELSAGNAAFDGLSTVAARQAAEIGTLQRPAGWPLIDNSGSQHGSDSTRTASSQRHPGPSSPGPVTSFNNYNNNY